MHTNRLTFICFGICSVSITAFLNHLGVFLDFIIISGPLYSSFSQTLLEIVAWTTGTEKFRIIVLDRDGNIFFLSIKKNSLSMSISSQQLIFVKIFCITFVQMCRVHPMFDSLPSSCYHLVRLNLHLNLQMKMQHNKIHSGRHRW